MKDVSLKIYLRISLGVLALGCCVAVFVFSKRNDSLEDAEPDLTALDHERVKTVHKTEKGAVPEYKRNPWKTFAASKTDMDTMENYPEFRDLKLDTLSVTDRTSIAWSIRRVNQSFSVTAPGVKLPSDTYLVDGTIFKMPVESLQKLYDEFMEKATFDDPVWSFAENWKASGFTHSDLSFSDEVMVVSFKSLPGAPKPGIYNHEDVSHVSISYHFVLKKGILLFTGGGRWYE